jgi:hypothetical protein
MLLDLVAKVNRPSYDALPPAEARRQYLETRTALQPDAPDLSAVKNLDAEGPVGAIPLRLYRPLHVPADALLPALIYFHGGGWVIGDLDSHDVLCRQLADQCGAAVVAVEYRLGPEHKFPAAVDDGWRPRAGSPRRRRGDRWYASGCGRRQRGRHAVGGHRAHGARPRRSRASLAAPHLSRHGHEGRRAVMDYLCHGGMIHGFTTMGKILDMANRVVSHAADSLRQALRGGG